MMFNLDKLWEGIFRFDTYSKGAEYSASDIVGSPMMVKLRKLYPNNDDMDYKDKISAWIGTAIHERVEQWIKSEIDFGTDNIESEVKLLHKNLSGTADIILDGDMIADIKTGKEKNIQAKIKKPDDWIKQLSIYSYLLSKQRKQKMNRMGKIAWLCVDTQKHGILDIELLSEKETIELIKVFMAEMKKPIEKTERCNLCIQFMNRWCNQRNNCPHWVVDEDFSNIEEW